MRRIALILTVVIVAEQVISLKALLSPNDRPIEAVLAF
jgi:hypothetical protein